MTLTNGDIITLKKEHEIRSSRSYPMLGLNETMLKSIHTGGIHIVKNLRYYDDIDEYIFCIDRDCYTYAADWVESKLTQAQLVEDVMV